VTVGEWTNDSSIDPKSRWNRGNTIALFEKANRAGMDKVLDDIRADRLNVYAACKRFLDAIRKTHAPLTVCVHRSQLVGLFQSTLGEHNFSRITFDRLCPNGAAYVKHQKLIPSREQVVTMLNIAPLTYKALAGGLACGAFRLNEWLALKMCDLEIRKEGYARVKLQAEHTKARYLRYSFVTREILDWVNALQNTNPSEYVFGGLRGHLASAQVRVKGLYREAGLHDGADGSTYCAHSFRTFAGDELRACGLRDKYVLAIIGHKQGAEGSYLDWNRIEKEWFERCAEKMCFVTSLGDPEQKKEVERLQSHNGKLEALLEKLLEKLT